MNISKCSFLGAPAVGKTTLLKLLAGKEIVGQYIPTQGFDRGTINVGKKSVCAWDFGGQREFLPFYKEFFMGSDLIVVVTDSTPVNLLQTKQLVEWARNLNEDDDCNIIAIANKQDLPGHMDAKRIENVLGVPTYPMVAIDAGNRERMYEILKRHVGRTPAAEAGAEAAATTSATGGSPGATGTTA